MALWLLACMDYGTHTWNDVEQPLRDPPGLEDSGADAHTHDSDPAGDPDDPGDPGDPGEPPDGDPPDDWTEGCEEGEEAPSGPAIYVLGWDDTYAESTLTAPDAGWYHVYSDQIMESGSSQLNESAFFRVPNYGNPEGTPLWSNCEDDWIVEDGDNSGWPSGKRLYIGTFWLEAGDNKLEMRHYCPKYRAGACTGFHDTSGSSTCESDSPNSVHYEGYGTCLRRAR